MLPGPDDVVELLARALSLDALPVPEQLVPGVDPSMFYAPGDELPGRVQLSLGREVVVEGAYKAQPDAPVVVVEGVGTLDAPAPALVDEAVAADQEVVGDVVPALGLDVEGLGHPDVEHALGLGEAVDRGRVADYHVHRWQDCQPGGRLVRRLSAPLHSTDYQQSGYRRV